MGWWKDLLLILITSIMFQKVNNYLLFETLQFVKIFYKNQKYF
jgi:hypothetical protein